MEIGTVVIKWCSCKVQHHVTASLSKNPGSLHCHYNSKMCRSLRRKKWESQISKMREAAGAGRGPVQDVRMKVGWGKQGTILPEWREVWGSRVPHEWREAGGSRPLHHNHEGRLGETGPGKAGSQTNGERPGEAGCHAKWVQGGWGDLLKWHATFPASFPFAWEKSVEKIANWRLHDWTWLGDWVATKGELVAKHPNNNHMVIGIVQWPELQEPVIQCCCNFCYQMSSQ